MWWSLCEWSMNGIGDRLADREWLSGNVSCRDILKDKCGPDVFDDMHSVYWWIWLRNTQCIEVIFRWTLKMRDRRERWSDTLNSGGQNSYDNLGRSTIARHETQHISEARCSRFSSQISYNFRAKRAGLRSLASKFEDRKFRPLKFESASGSWRWIIFGLTNRIVLLCKSITFDLILRHNIKGYFGTASFLATAVKIQEHFGVRWINFRLNANIKRVNNPLYGNLIIKSRISQGNKKLLSQSRTVDLDRSDTAQSPI
jgi:hypothetical protein